MVASFTQRVLHSLQLLTLFVVISILVQSRVNAQIIQVSLSSTAPTNPYTYVWYTFTATGPVPSPQGAMWGGLTFDYGIPDPNTHIIQWESYGRFELFTTAALNESYLSEFYGTPCFARATGYYLQSSSSGVTYYYSNILGLYSPI